MDYNFSLVKLYADFLNNTDDIEKSIRSIMETGVDDVTAVRLFIAEYCGLDTIERDRNFFRRYFPVSLKKLSVEDYISDPYYKNISFPNRKVGNITFERSCYKPFQPFVFDDLFLNLDGMVIPRVGFFDKEFSFPKISENGREWMTITPNEINTMKTPIARARGKVLCLGLGLGYFAYMTSLKEDVSEIVIIEKSGTLINLFEENILPQFSHKEKIKIIEADAFDYLKNCQEPTFDYLFADLWHDCGDGVEVYLKLKEFERDFPNCEFSYWIEKSIRFFL